MSSTLPVVDQVLNGIFIHETNMNYQEAGALTLASTGTSGYTVGLTQFDFSAHATNDAQDFNDFQDVLTTTAKTTGLTPLQISQIMQGITISHGSPLVTPYIKQIDQALQTDQGWAFITGVDSEDLDIAVNTVDSLISAANKNPNGAGALAKGSLDPQAVAELAAYVNQFGPNVGQHKTFLQGGTAYLGPPGDPQPYQSDGTLDLSDINDNFMSHLYQYTQYPNQYTQFLSSAASAAQLSSKGKIIDIPDSTVSETQEVSNGTVSSDVGTVAPSGDTVESVGNTNAQGQTTTGSLIVDQPYDGSVTISAAEGGTSFTYSLPDSSSPSILFASAGETVSSDVAGVVLVGVDGSALVGGSGSQLLVQFGSGSSVTAGGESSQVLVVGSDDTETTQFSSVLFTVRGNNNTTSLFYGDTANLSGSGETVSGGTADLVALGAGTDATVAGANQTVDMNASNDNLTATSAGYQVNLFGNNNYVAGSLDFITFGAAALKASVVGSGDTVHAYVSNFTIVIGSSDTVDAGTGGVVALYGQSSVTVNGVSETVDIDAENETVVAAGASDQIYLFANNYTVTASGDALTVALAGIDGIVVGNNNALTLGATGDTANFYGTGEYVAGSARDAINLDAGSETVVVAITGNTVNLFAGGDSLTASGDTVVFAAIGVTESVGGSNDVVQMSSGSVLDLSGGGGNQIYATGASIVAAAGVSGTIIGSGNISLSLGTSDSFTIQSGNVTVDGAHPSQSSSVGTVTTDASGNMVETFSGNPNERIFGYIDGTWADEVVYFIGGAAGVTEQITNHATNGAVAEQTTVSKTSILNGGFYGFSTTYYDTSNTHTWSNITFTYAGTPGAAGVLEGISINNHDGSSVSGYYVDAPTDYWLTFNVYHQGQIFGGDTYHVYSPGFGVPFSGMSLPQLLGGDTSGDLAALSFILQPSSLENVQVSAATEAVAAAGAYSNLYGSYNNIIANALNSASNICVPQVQIGNYVYNFPCIGDGNATNSPNASSNTNGNAPTPTNSATGTSFETGILSALAVNLTGQPITTTTQSGSPAYFDVSGDGTLSQTGWVTPGEGVLINDPGGSLTSIQASDLVSSFSALSALDLTHAGFLNATDPGWANLRVWVDTSGAADFQQGSAYSLDQLGITSIDLHPVTVNAASNSNQIYQTDSLAVAGHTGAIAQLGLTYMTPVVSGHASA